MRRSHKNWISSSRLLGIVALVEHCQKAEHLLWDVLDDEDSDNCNRHLLTYCCVIWILDQNIVKNQDQKNFGVRRINRFPFQKLIEYLLCFLDSYNFVCWFLSIFMGTVILFVTKDKAIFKSCSANTVVYPVNIPLTSNVDFHPRSHLLVWIFNN